MKRLLFFLLILLTTCSHSTYASTDPVQPDGKAGTDRKLALIELYSLSNQLPRELIDLQNNLEAMKSVSSLETQVPGFADIIKELEWEVNIAESTPDISYHHLALLDSKLEKVKVRIDSLNREVETNVENLQRWYTDWLTREEDFTKYREAKGRTVGSGDVTGTVLDIERLIDEAKKLLEERLASNLQAGKSVGEIQTRVYLLNATVVELLQDTNALRIQQTSPSMLSQEFYQRLDARLLKESWYNVRLFFLYQWGYFKQNVSLVGCGVLTIGLLALLIHLSRKLVTASSRWYDYASRPVATAVFAVTAAFSMGSSMSIHLNLPPDWETLLQLPLILAVACLADLVTDVAWQNSFLRWLVLFLGLTLLLTVINIPHSIFYLFVFYAAVVVFCISFYSFILRWRNPKVRTVTWAIWLWGLFPLVIVVAGISGYDQLAVLIFGRVLVMVSATVSIWLVLQILSGLLEVLLLYFPISLVRNNSGTIVRQLYPLLVILHGVWWLATILMVFWVYPTLGASFEAITSLKFTFSTFDITPGSVLIIVLVCYATALCSRAARAFLTQEVLPRHGAEKGVQVSITRLVHYAIVTIGLLVLLRILGFGLNQIAILGGALSVGIGFGLQAIVNNFVSGLILLFERPIKVGDVIEVGEEVGEVKELGLRATTVQTFDNAEIVIPNSELITGSVTNWTLAEKRARVRVPVGVAYGTDIEQVLKILQDCADSNPTVLSTPKPRALFLTFGASSLDFELRVWIPNVMDRLDVLSELNQDIESEFGVAGIEIPFPQTDLHVRSVDEKIAGSFLGSSHS